MPCNWRAVGLCTFMNHVHVQCVEMIGYDCHFDILVAEETELPVETCSIEKCVCIDGRLISAVSLLAELLCRS